MFAGGGGFLSVIGQALSKIALPIAIVTTAIFALKGGLEEFPGVLVFIKDQAATLMEMIGRLGNTFSGLTDQGSALNMVGAAIGGMFGGLLSVLSGVVMIIGSVVVAFDVLFRLLGQGLQMMWAGWHGDFDGYKAAFNGMGGVYNDGVDKLGALWFGDKSKNNGVFGEQKGPNGETLGANGMPVNPKGDNNINIANMKVEVKAEANADPARIAVAFGEVLNHVTKYRTQGKRIPGMAG